MPADSNFNQFTGTDGYVVSGPLIDAVNCAIALERPLLIKGEPGTGKTLLAKHVAEGLGLPMESWHIKSTSKTSDGLYVYDTVQRLNDARFGGGDVSDIRKYIKLGPLGRVFKSTERHLLLIDEIDRADDEFEAFLLEVLSDFQITVPEIGSIRAEQPPAVILTSNRTRELHDALKRRCVYHWIDYPTLERELEIVRVRAPEVPENLAREVAAAVARIRELDVAKRPGVAETIDWARAMTTLGATEFDREVAEETVGWVAKEREDLDLVRESLSDG